MIKVCIVSRDPSSQGGQSSLVRGPGDSTTLSYLSPVCNVHPNEGLRRSSVDLFGDLAEQVLLLSRGVQGLLCSGKLIEHSLGRCLLHVSRSVSGGGLDRTQNLVLPLVKHSVTRVDRLVTIRECHRVNGSCIYIAFK